MRVTIINNYHTIGKVRENKRDELIIEKYVLGDNLMN